MSNDLRAAVECELTYLAEQGRRLVELLGPDLDILATAKILTDLSRIGGDLARLVEKVEADIWELIKEEAGAR
jgi:hypothetical protein